MVENKIPPPIFLSSAPRCDPPYLLFFISYLHSCTLQIFLSSLVIVLGSTAKYSTAPTIIIRMMDKMP